MEKSWGLLIAGATLFDTLPKYFLNPEVVNHVAVMLEADRVRFEGGIMFYAGKLSQQKKVVRSTLKTFGTQKEKDAFRSIGQVLSGVPGGAQGSWA